MSRIKFEKQTKLEEQSRYRAQQVASMQNVSTYNSTGVALN